jgi:Transglycosylase SLT domain
MKDEKRGAAGDAAFEAGVGVAVTLGRRLLALKLLPFVLLGLLVFLLFVPVFAATNSTAVGGAQVCSFEGGGTAQIPTEYLPWLNRAVARYRLGPRGFSILAAVHKVESDFGRSTSPGVTSGTNSAGAAGPGQFLAGTWSQYGVDADGDRQRDVYSVPDSIFGSANYLASSGAPGDWYSALFAYNHADWYVQMVFRTADAFRGRCVTLPAIPPVPGQMPSNAVDRLAYIARWIESQRFHYCWGGGHAPTPGPSEGTYCWTAQEQMVYGSSTRGLDCSGAVRWLLVLAGYSDPGGLASDSLGGAYPPGPGRRVTIWSNPAHVFITIDGVDWGTGSSHYAHGPAFGDQSSDAFLPSHPPGL